MGGLAVWATPVVQSVAGTAFAATGSTAPTTGDGGGTTVCETYTFSVGAWCGGTKQTVTVTITSSSTACCNALKQQFDGCTDDSGRVDANKWFGVAANACGDRHPGKICTYSAEVTQNGSTTSWTPQGFDCGELDRHNLSWLGSCFGQSLDDGKHVQLWSPFGPSCGTVLPRS